MTLYDVRPTNWLHMTCERLSDVLYRLHFVSVARYREKTVVADVDVGRRSSTEYAIMHTDVDDTW